MTTGTTWVKGSYLSNMAAQILVTWLLLISVVAASTLGGGEGGFRLRVNVELSLRV